MKAIRRTDEQTDRAATINQRDREQARDYWKRLAPRKYQELIEAEAWKGKK